MDEELHDEDCWCDDCIRMGCGCVGWCQCEQEPDDGPTYPDC